MPRTKTFGDIAVIPASLILVADQQTDWRTGRFPFKDPGEDFHGIRLTTLCHVARSTRLATVELSLNFSFAQLNPRRATVNDAADGRPV